MTYQLLLTNLGQQKIAAAASAGSDAVHITQFAVGQGVNVDFSQRLDQQVLVSKRYQGAVESVAPTAITGQYEITCIVPIDQGGWTIRELGLIDSEGALIWVGQLPDVQKPVANSTAAVDYRIKAVIQIDNPDVTVVIDASAVTATRSWVSDNFVSNPRFASFLELAFPYGYPYWTHSKTNPKPLFDAMFGYETHWRRLEGLSLVAVKDGDAYIGQPMLNLGQRGTTELANSVRPHTYPVYTNYLFERYDPSTVVETVWNVVADKTSINESDTVRFTITANNLPDGQILDWFINEGVLDSASNTITSPDKSDADTVILTNGQAVIDFTTTPDDNETEVQKHVRLTVGAPANLSINVPINDAGFSEIALHISQSTTEGIDLAEYYKAQAGQYPSATDTVRFIVDSGVDVIAPDTQTPAITEGANWPVGAQIIIENRGRIIGHGGAGGSSARYSQKVSVYPQQFFYDLTQPAAAGQNGGTAINGSIKVDNYGLIYGGGGGGGGSGLYYIDNGEFGQSALVDGVKRHLYVGGGGGSGGGAPYGARYPNLNTVSEFLEHFNDANLVPLAANAGQTLNFVAMNDIGSSNSSSYVYGIIRNGDSISTPVPELVCEAKDVTQFKAEKWTDETETFYYSDNDMQGIVKQSQNATLSTGGEHGYDVAHTYRVLRHNVDGLTVLREVPVTTLKQNHGGNGGGLGENGSDGVMVSFYDWGGVTTGVVYKKLLPATGGLAGYIKEGNVTINNLTGGLTKGRVA